MPYKINYMPYKILLTLALAITSNVFAYGYHVFNTSTGNIEECGTLPKINRTIEQTNDGIIVTYSIDNVLFMPDDIIEKYLLSYTRRFRPIYN